MYLIRITSAALKKAVFLTGILLLPACGGGGGGGGSGGNNNAPGQDSGVGGDGDTPGVGYFLDSAVAGLSYQTRNDAGAVISGETGPNGEYPLYDDRAIYFAIGKLVLGTIPARSRTTPFSFMSAGSGETVPVNIARYLQTLDDDGNPDNGIAITAATRTAFTETNKTFSDDYFSRSDFSALAEDDIQYLLDNPDIALVDSETARAHLQGTLETIDEQISLPGTRWRTEYSPLFRSWYDEEQERWRTQQTCTGGEFDLYRIDTYDAARVASTYWNSFDWVPTCERTGEEVTEDPRDYDINTLCGQKLADEPNANLTVCSFADLNSVVSYERDGVSFTVYSAYAPDSGVVYRTTYKEYDVDAIRFREKWQSITTQLLEE